MSLSLYKRETSTPDPCKETFVVLIESAPGCNFLSSLFPRLFYHFSQNQIPEMLKPRGLMCRNRPTLAGDIAASSRIEFIFVPWNVYPINLPIANRSLKINALFHRFVTFGGSGSPLSAHTGFFRALAKKTKSRSTRPPSKAARASPLRNRPRFCLVFSPPRRRVDLGSQNQQPTLVIRSPAEKWCVLPPHNRLCGVCSPIFTAMRFTILWVAKWRWSVRKWLVEKIAFSSHLIMWCWIFCLDPPSCENFKYKGSRHQA